MIKWSNAYNRLSFQNLKERVMVRLDLRSQEIPAAISRNAYVEGDALVEGGFFNAILRYCIPGYASSQDQRITLFFLNFCKEFIRNEHLFFNREKCLSLLQLSRDHLAYCLQGRASTAIPQEMADLERYILAIRMHVKDFASEHEQSQSKELCQRHCQKLYDKWINQGHSSDAFWSAPDLVDLVMRSFWHKVMRHSIYRDTINMRSDSFMRGGQYVCAQEPQVKIQGHLYSWANVRSRFFKDNDNRIYTRDNNGHKVYWWYFKEGLIPWDKFNWEIPHPFTTLNPPPLQTQVEIVTSHAKKRDWVVLDHYLKGVRHAFLRVVFGEDFAKSHPNSRYKPGEVYSFGFGFNGKNFSKFFPLTTLPGKMMSPDYAEFDDENLRVTPLDITGDQAAELMAAITQRAHEPLPFHPINANCAAAVAQLLSRAHILELPVERHMLMMWYKFLVPKSIRKPIEAVGPFFESIVPSFMSTIIATITQLCHSIIFGPFFFIIGGHRVQIDPEDSLVYQWREMARPYFNHMIDVFNPNKMIATEARMIDRWQRKQPRTRFVEQ